MENRSERGFDFVTDSSAATEVLKGMGGVIINVEENYREFDPMQGKDDHLVENIQKMCEESQAEFVALVGRKSPDGMRIDFRYVQRMIEMKTCLPAISFDTDDSASYDSGLEIAWLSLFQTFAGQSFGMEPGIIGVLGATLYDVGLEGFHSSRRRLWTYGMGAGMEEIKKAANVMKNVVVSPSGLKAARYLAKRFGTPYEVLFPLEQIKGYDTFLQRIKEDLNEPETRRKILIMHQQVLTHNLRNELRRLSRVPIVTATSFMMDKELREPWDIPVMNQDHWEKIVMEGGYDIIIADPYFKKLIPDYEGRFYGLTHFAVSGKYLEFQS